MAFSVPVGTNASAVVADAETYHGIRVFTVGQATQDLENAPMDDLQTVQSGWSRPIGDAFNNSKAGGQFGQCKDVNAHPVLVVRTRPH